MKRYKQLFKNAVAQSRDMSFEDLFDEIGDDWQEEARRLQARRWHKIHHQEMLFR